MEKPERDPTDPADPFYAMAETFRREVTQIALKAHSITLYRELSPREQLEAFVAGTLAGVVGSCLVCVSSEEGADAMMEYLSEYLPYARKVAESLVDDNGTHVLKRRAQ